MLIHREGSYANHGVSSVVLDNIGVTFNPGTGCLELRHKVARDFNTPATHDYMIELSVRELGMLVQALAGASEEESFEGSVEPLRRSLKDLLTLAVACAPSGEGLESPS